MPATSPELLKNIDTYPRKMNFTESAVPSLRGICVLAYVGKQHDYGMSGCPVGLR
jgi:hypothetical protein